jgi:transcription antitermination factor NusG
MNGAEVREISFGVKVGDVVEVAEGPMRGLKGVVERIASGEERVRILLEFLGRQNFVEIPAHKIISDRQAREAMKR